jgi:GalNAc5-diNAcBac-PP-undecaprenol beta-1,3-glucosyltransferase
MPLVTVVVPTHDHGGTLEWSLRSVLEQTVSDFRLVVIGDGVGEDTRDVIASIDDDRLEFWDRPKQPRHAENLRDELLQTLDTRFVAYHGDDDLLLPHHLEEMLAVLGDADFVHPVPAFIHPGPSVRVAAIDLSQRADRRSVLAPIHRSVISLTGVVHTLRSYRQLPYGWRTTPSGVATDQYMWRQYLACGSVRAVSATRATTIKLTAVSRKGHDGAMRAKEIEAWWRLIHRPGFVARWDGAIDAATRAARWRTVPHQLLASGLQWLPVPVAGVALRDH